MSDEKTTDLLYTYKRKTSIENGVLKFTFEHDLNDEITEADLADMLIYCCQRDTRMQKILLKRKLGEQSTLAEVLAAANEYRKILLVDKD